MQIWSMQAHILVIGRRKPASIAFGSGYLGLLSLSSHAGKYTELTSSTTVKNHLGWANNLAR